MSVLDKNGLGDWIADRLADIGDSVNDGLPLRVDRHKDPFHRLAPAGRESAHRAAEPESDQPFVRRDEEPVHKAVRAAGQRSRQRGGQSRKSSSGRTTSRTTASSWWRLTSPNPSTSNTGAVWDTFDPVANPGGGRLKAAIQEAGNASTAIGLVGQSVSPDPGRHVGVWALSGTYGAFTPLIVPARARVEPAKPRQPVPDGGFAHSGGTLRPGDGGGRADSLRHIRAAGVEALPERAGDHAQLLGLQRRRPRLLRRRRNSGARSESRRHSLGKSRARTSP